MIATLTALVLASPSLAPPLAPAPGDLVPDLRAPEALADAGGGDGGPLGVLGIACALVPGFGIGHFFIGDVAGGVTFLLLEGGVLLAGLVVYIVGVMVTVLTFAKEPGAVLLANAGFYGGFIGAGIVHVWQLIDLIIKVASPSGGGGSPARVLDPS